MYNGTCVTHVSWCTSGSLTRGGGETFPAFSAHAQPTISRIWKEAHNGGHAIRKTDSWAVLQSVGQKLDWKFLTVWVWVWMIRNPGFPMRRWFSVRFRISQRRKSYLLNITFMFSRCRRSLAVVTPVKYEYDARDVGTDMFAKVEYPQWIN